MDESSRQIFLVQDYQHEFSWLNIQISDFHIGICYLSIQITSYATKKLTFDIINGEVDVISDACVGLNEFKNYQAKDN